MGEPPGAIWGWEILLILFVLVLFNNLFKLLLQPKGPYKKNKCVHLKLTQHCKLPTLQFFFNF